MAEKQCQWFVGSKVTLLFSVTSDLRKTFCIHQLSYILVRVSTDNLSQQWKKTSACLKALGTQTGATN